MQKIAQEDTTFIERFQRGHQDAFDGLVQRNKGRAYQYAFRLTKNPDEAADIVAEAFVRVYRSLKNFKGESSFSTWLYRIETNCFLDMRKKAHCRKDVSLDDALLLNDGYVDTQIADTRETPHDHLERGERLAAINAAMLRLPKRHQAILNMYHAESMSYEEIADSLEMPIGTVKSRLNRARLRLRDTLRPCRGLFIRPSVTLQPTIQA